MSSPVALEDAFERRNILRLRVDVDTVTRLEDDAALDSVRAAIADEDTYPRSLPQRKLADAAAGRVGMVPDDELEHVCKIVIHASEGDAQPPRSVRDG